MVEHTDPVKALMAAHGAGLLVYRGFVSGERYEADVAGRRMMFDEADVVDVVTRIRAVHSLSKAGFVSRLIRLDDDGTHHVGVVDWVAALPAGQVVDWCEGFLAAHAGEGQDHAGLDQSGQLAQLFEGTSLNDQCKMTILGLMYGQGDDKLVSADKLAELIGALPLRGIRRKPTKKTVVQALTFGKGLSADLAESMVRAFGYRWQVTAAATGTTAAVPGSSRPAPEMPALALLRRLVAASQQDWLRYVGEPRPNRARWAKVMKVTIGQTGYALDVDGLGAWLDGVAAFHLNRAEARPADA